MQDVRNDEVVQAKSDKRSFVVDFLFISVLLGVVAAIALVANMEGARRAEVWQANIQAEHERNMQVLDELDKEHELRTHVSDEYGFVFEKTDSVRGGLKFWNVLDGDTGESYPYAFARFDAEGEIVVEVFVAGEGLQVLSS